MQKFKLVGDEIYSEDDQVYEEDYSGDCEDNQKKVFKPSKLLED